MVDRKYVLTKVAAGDYLLLANDGKRVWRIHKHQDGPSTGLTDWPKDKEFWCYSKWTGGDRYIDPKDWARWEFMGGYCRTQAEAIKEALGL